MTLPELDLWEFLGLAAALYLLWAVFRYLRKCWKLASASRHLKRFEQARDGMYYGAGDNPSDRRYHHTRSHTHLEHEEPAPEHIKDKDARVHAMAEPKGFWTGLILGEKMNLIREMIKISRSSEHRGYWQDRVEAQKRVEGQRTLGDGQER